MNIAFHRRIPIRARVLAASLLLAVIGAAAAAPAATAAPLAPAPGAPPAGVVSWSVVPAGATAADSRNLFSYQNIKPGTSILDHVAVFNRSKQAVAFTIYATDATGTTANGALTLLPANRRSFYIGTWTTFPRHVRQLSVIIPGGQGVIEPFTILVPFRATPGDHVGGMIAAVGVLHRNPNGQMVTLYQRIAVPIELRVTGKLLAALTVKSVGVGFSNPLNPFGGGSAHVSYTVVNTGNVLLAGTQVVTISGPFGAKSTIKMHALPTMLPGDSLQYTASAGGVFPAGPVHASVAITPKWPADATPLAVTLVSASGSGSAFTMPWALLLVVILLGGGGYGWSRVIRRRRQTHQAEIAAAADRARRETERRLLGNTNGKPAPNGKSTPKPGTSPAAKAEPAAKAAPDAAASTPTGTAGGSGQPE